MVFALTSCTIRSQSSLLCLTIFYYWEVKPFCSKLLSESGVFSQPLMHR
jgi:hypothetical protein